MTTPAQTLIKPLAFQTNRGPLSGDDLYTEANFIIAPNRYRKLIGKTPYTQTMETKVDAAANTVLMETEYSDIETFKRDVLKTYLETPDAVCSAGLRMFALSDEEQIVVQQAAIKMMKDDWPEFADKVIGYEPHFNMFDEILLWKK